MNEAKYELLTNRDNDGYIISLQREIGQSKPIKPDPNEPYDIGYFNPSDSRQSQALTDIDRHPRAIKYQDPPRASTPDEIDALIRADLTDQEVPVLMFPILNKDQTTAGYIEYYLEDDEQRLQEVKAQTSVPDNALVLIVSYSKLFPKTQWPKDSSYIRRRENLLTDENKGVAESGMRQTLPMLVQMESAIAKADSNKIPARPIFVVAYTNPKNLPSESAVRKNDFELLPKLVDYDGEFDHAWIKPLAQLTNR